MSVPQGQHAECDMELQMEPSTTDSGFTLWHLVNTDIMYSDSEITPMALSLLSGFMTMNATVLVQYTHFNS